MLVIIFVNQELYFSILLFLVLVVATFFLTSKHNCQDAFCNSIFCFVLWPKSASLKHTHTHTHFFVYLSLPPSLSISSVHTVLFSTLYFNPFSLSFLQLLCFLFFFVISSYIFFSLSLFSLFPTLSGIADSPVNFCAQEDKLHFLQFCNCSRQKMDNSFCLS